MILKNTVSTSVNIQGAASVSKTPADEVAPRGFSTVSDGAGWIAVPSDVVTVAPSVTVTTTAVIDWSTAGIFQYQLTAAAAFAPSFSNALVGQTIKVILTQPATSTQSTLSHANMGTITFGGGTSTLSTTNSYVDILTVTCIASGVYIADLVLHYV